ncbi:MAG: metal-dependent hydrolase [Nanoarchaeota archaeon]|nr:metal-dependent hydrolase [Nanoarchaeota archaeon]
MPLAVLHILLPLVIMSLFKDIYEGKKKKRFFSLHYVLIAGLAGLLPDLDIVVFWGLHFLGYTISEVHRTFTHNIFIPLAFLLMFFVFQNVRMKKLGRHKLRLNVIFLMIALGYIVHLALDALFIGLIMPFYPVSFFEFGLNLINLLPYPLNEIFIPSLDAILFFLWLIWLELKHKISDFI